MKRILIPMISIATLCFYGVAQEETNLVDPIEEYCKIIRERVGDPNLQQVNHAIQRLYELERLYYLDRRLTMPQGNQDALDLIRNLLREKLPGIAAFKTGQEFADWINTLPKKNSQVQNFFALKQSFQYLIMKGDERDLDLIPIPHWRSALAMRVAGTNLIDYSQFFDSTGIFRGSHDIIPSVTNTGRQAVYVVEILRQYWMNMELNEDGYRDRDKIPAELLTMVVWFDEDGKPVCNVDLAKYGLTMPELDVPNKPKMEGERPREPDKTHEPESPTNVVEAGRVTASRVAETEERLGETPLPYPWKLPLLIGTFVITGTIITWWCYFKRK